MGTLEFNNRQNADKVITADGTLEHNAISKGGPGSGGARGPNGQYGGGGSGSKQPLQHADGSGHAANSHGAPTSHAGNVASEHHDLKDLHDKFGPTIASKIDGLKSGEALKFSQGSKRFEAMRHGPDNFTSREV